MKGTMLFLEVSLLAFLLQGNNASGLEAITRTSGISALIVGLDILLKALYLFGFGVLLFNNSNEHTHHVKWNLWVIHKLLLTAVYMASFCFISGGEKGYLQNLPFISVTIMFILNAIALFACGLSGNGAAFGF